MAIIERPLLLRHPIPMATTPRDELVKGNFTAFNKPLSKERILSTKQSCVGFWSEVDMFSLWNLISWWKLYLITFVRMKHDDCCLKRKQYTKAPRSEQMIWWFASTWISLKIRESPHPKVTTTRTPLGGVLSVIKSWWIDGMSGTFKFPYLQGSLPIGSMGLVYIYLHYFRTFS